MLRKRGVSSMSAHLSLSVWRQNYATMSSQMEEPISWQEVEIVQTESERKSTADSMGKKRVP